MLTRSPRAQLTLTYSYSWISAFSSLPYSKVLRALKHVLLAQITLSIAIVAALKRHIALGGQPWPFWELPHATVSVALGARAR